MKTCAGSCLTVCNIIKQSLFILLMCFAFEVVDAGEGPAQITPSYKILADEFGADEADIRALIQSAEATLYPNFPDYKIEPIIIRRGGPIVEYKRTQAGEIVMRLNTKGLLWSQYAYQYAHEFCHILCGFKEGDQSNQWFEETLCETASLFVLREMAKRWKDNPPYKNWASYRDALRNYTDNIFNERTTIEEIYKVGLPAFYQNHQKILTESPVQRELNGAMAIILLRYFEQTPSHWEAIRWINVKKDKQQRSFSRYLQDWHNAVPERHRAFVKTIADLYAVALTASP